MSVLSVKHFDSLEYVKQAKKLGASEELAEFQAKQMERAIEVAISQMESKELATKQDIKEFELSNKQELKDLELKIEQTKNQIILWISGLILASGLIQHFLNIK